MAVPVRFELTNPFRAPESKSGVSSQFHQRTILLTRLGSNQDSSEPKSDVLPITPRVNLDAMRDSNPHFRAPRPAFSVVLPRQLLLIASLG